MTDPRIAEIEERLKLAATYTAVRVGYYLSDIAYLLERLRELEARVCELEEAITEASLGLCESAAPEAKAAMTLFGKVMDAAAMKRMGI
jgi:hypothetical protein